MSPSFSKASLKLLATDLFCLAFTTATASASDFLAKSPFFWKAISTANDIGSKGCSDHYGWQAHSPHQTPPPIDRAGADFSWSTTARKEVANRANPNSPPPSKLIASGSWTKLIFRHDRNGYIFCKGSPISKIRWNVIHRKPEWFSDWHILGILPQSRGQKNGHSLPTFQILTFKIRGALWNYSAQNSMPWMCGSCISVSWPIQPANSDRKVQ